LARFWEPAMFDRLHMKPHMTKDEIAPAASNVIPSPSLSAVAPVYDRRPKGFALPLCGIARHGDDPARRAP